MKTPKHAQQPNFTRDWSLLVRVGLFMSLMVVVGCFYSLSSASSSNEVSVGGNGAVGLAGAHAKVVEQFLPTTGYRSFLPVPVSSPEILATYRSDCTTPETNFSVGDTVCVKATDVPVSAFASRRLDWGAPDSTIVHSNTIAGASLTASFLINATSIVNGRTIDNRGKWQLVIVNPFTAFPEIITTFTVSDPQNLTADLGVSIVGQPPSVQAGGQAVFVLQVNNYGPDSSTSVQLSDVVPANTTFVSFAQLTGPVFTCNNPAVNDTGTTTCSLASMASGDTATFVVTYQVDGGATVGTEISNSTNIASGTSDTNNQNDSDTRTTNVITSPCVVSCPSNITQPADSGQAGAVVSYSTPGVTGDCGQPAGEGGGTNPTVSCSAASGSFFPVGTTTVICTAKSGDSCTFQVSVENPGGLSITLNGSDPLGIECGNPAFTDPGASAVNGIGQSVPVTVTTPQGFNPDTPAAGSYIITYTATEGQNSVSTTRTVNVTDSQAPRVTLDGPNSITFSCGQAFVDPGVSASDGCDSLRALADPLRIPLVTSSVEVRTSFDIGPPPDNAEINEVYAPAPSGVDTNTPGKYRITYTATDSGNRTGTTTRIVIVVPGGGTAPPNLTLIGEPQMTVECGSFTDPGATATVPCGGTVPVTTSGTVDAHTPGTYTITYTACVIDTNTNLCDPARTDSVDRTVTVEDTTAPTITVDGANPLQVECHGTFNDPGATAHDTCAGNFAATASGTVDPNTVGQYTITYNGTDPSGNVATPVTRTVNVVDTTDPTVTAPADVTVNTGAGATSCSAAVSDAVLGTGSANDLCQGSLAVTRSGVPAGNVFPVGQTIVTYSATDAYNHTGTATQKVTVVDNTPPTITAPAHVTANTGPGATTCGTEVNPGTATATDNCGSVTITRSPSGNAFPVGNTTVTWTATDTHGNSSSANQTVTVIDTTPPVISCQADIVADFDPAANGAVVTYTAPVGTDNCPGASTVRTTGLASGATFPLGTTTNTFTVTDGAGLTATCSFKVTVALTSIIGLNSVSITGSGLVDSYDSAGGYPATKGSLANILSNGTITLGGSGKVFGNVRSTRVGVVMTGSTTVTGNATAGTTVSKGASAIIGGTITNGALAPVMTLPSVPACGPPYSSNSGISGTYSYNASTGDLTLSGINNATLANGNYCFHNLTLTNSGQLKVNGPVKIKLTGTLNTSGATSLPNTTLIPSNLRILSSYSGSNGVNFGNSSSLQLVVYAPNTGVSITGSSPLFGTVAGKTLTIGNSGMIHYDTQLKTIWPDIWTLIFGP